MNFFQVSFAFVICTYPFYRVKGDSQAWKDSQVCPGSQAQKGLLVPEVQR